MERERFQDLKRIFLEACEKGPGEAENLQREVLGAERRTLGPEHDSTLRSVYNLGRLLQDQKKMEEAEALLLEALAGRRRIQGPHHPETLGIARDLGRFYEAWGKPEKAEEYRALLPDRGRPAEASGPGKDRQ